MPIRNCVDTYKKALPPDLNVTDITTSSNIDELISQTLCSIIDLETTFKPAEEKKMNIAVTSKFGIDGLRNHQIRQQSTSNIVNDDDDSDDKQGKNYVGAFWCSFEF